MLIATSIIYMAIENAMGAGVRWRWMIAFGFGLLLGFHFSFGLRPALQFAGAHAMTSLIAFGAGVAAGQIVVLLILVPAVALLVRLLGDRAAAFLLSLVAGHIAWHWMVDRGTLLSRYPFQWPASIPALHAGELGDRGHHRAGRFLGAVDDSRANRGGRAGCGARYCERGAVRLIHAEAGTSIQ